MDDLIQIFGLQRTGTNLVRYQLRLNFGIEINDSGAKCWKHGKLIAEPWIHEARYILCVRSPYTQLPRCYHYFRRAKSGRGDPTMPGIFELNCCFDDWLQVSCYEFANPIDRWNKMYAHWLSVLPEDRRVIVRQEDQLERQGFVIASMAGKLKLPWIVAEPVTTREHIDVGAEPWADFWRDELTPPQIERINSEIDPELMRYFGYLTPSI